jgi:hypothetical protein
VPDVEGELCQDGTMVAAQHLWLQVGGGQVGNQALTHEDVVNPGEMYQYCGSGSASINVDSWIRIRIRIKVKTRIRIRILGGIAHQSEKLEAFLKPSRNILEH